MTADETPRDQAVREVDARHGYTIEFSSSPEAHAAEYDERERELTAPETPAELRLRATRMRSALALELPGPVWAEVADIVDALLAENVQLRQAADLFRANFSPWLIANAPDLYRALWGEW